MNIFASESWRILRGPDPWESCRVQGVRFGVSRHGPEVAGCGNFMVCSGHCSGSPCLRPLDWLHSHPVLLGVGDVGSVVKAGVSDTWLELGHQGLEATDCGTFQGL